MNADHARLVAVERPITRERPALARGRHGSRPESVEDVVALCLALDEGELACAPRLGRLLAQYPLGRALAAVAWLRSHGLERTGSLEQDLRRALLTEHAPALVSAVVGLALEASYVGLAYFREGSLLHVEKHEVTGPHGDADHVESCLAPALAHHAGSVLAMESWEESRSSAQRHRTTATIERLSSAHGMSLRWLPRPELLATYGEPVLLRRKLRRVAAHLWPMIQPRVTNGAILDAAAVAFATQLAILTGRR
jgi:hypothetical protein